MSDKIKRLKHTLLLIERLKENTSYSILEKNAAMHDVEQFCKTLSNPFFQNVEYHFVLTKGYEEFRAMLLEEINQVT